MDRKICFALSTALWFVPLAVPAFADPISQHVFLKCEGYVTKKLSIDSNVRSQSNEKSVYRAEFVYIGSNFYFQLEGLGDGMASTVYYLTSDLKPGDRHEEITDSKISVGGHTSDTSGDVTTINFINIFLDRLTGIIKFKNTILGMGKKIIEAETSGDGFCERIDPEKPKF